MREPLPAERGPVEPATGLPVFFHLARVARVVAPMSKQVPVQE